MGDGTIREAPAMAKTAAIAMRSCSNMGRGVLGGWGRMKAMYLKSLGGVRPAYARELEMRAFL
jgi:hypothetical protein